MPKKILLQGVPEQVLSTQIGALYPLDIDTQENGQLIAGARFFIPYDPGTGTMVDCTLYNPKTVQDEPQRTPTKFVGSAVITAAGNTALWSPTASKRFRLMGGTVTIPNTSTSAAGTVTALYDGAVAIGITLTAIGATTTGIAYTFNLPGNGYLSSAAGNALNVNNTAVYTAGGVTVSVWGTEE